MQAALRQRQVASPSAQLRNRQLLRPRLLQVSAEAPRPLTHHLQTSLEAQEQEEEQQAAVEPARASASVSPLRLTSQPLLLLHLLHLPVAASLEAQASLLLEASPLANLPLRQLLQAQRRHQLLPLLLLAPACSESLREPRRLRPHPLRQQAADSVLAVSTPPVRLATTQTKSLQPLQAATLLHHNRPPHLLLVGSYSASQQRRRTKLQSPRQPEASPLGAPRQRKRMRPQRRLRLGASPLASQLKRRTSQQSLLPRVDSL
jgi:hypothetical protein